MPQNQPVPGPIVIHLGRLGDTVLLGSLLSILQVRYGQPCRLIGARPWCKQVFAGHPDVAQIWALDRHGSFFLRSDGWRVLTALRGDSRSPLYICETEPRRLRRVRRLLALAGVDPGRCLFLGHQVFVRDTHWADRFAAFGRLIPPGFEAAGGHAAALPVFSSIRCGSPGAAAPRLQITGGERTACLSYIHVRGWALRPIVLVQPGNRRTMRPRWMRPPPADSKAWPVERWAALLHRLHVFMPEAVLVLCGAERETALLNRIQTAAALPAVETAPVPLRLLFALCDRAFNMISVDTGPAHAAAALGLPLLVLFGEHSQRQWLPRSPMGTPVIGLGGPPDACRLDDLSVDEVFDGWLGLLARMRRQTQGHVGRIQRRVAADE